MESFKLLRTALVSLSAVRPARMDRYSDHILNLSRLYGSQLWGVIYAADVRMRQEHFEWLRRRGEADVSMLATDEMPKYYPSQPWDWVFEAAVYDFHFWQENVHQPSLLAAQQGFAGFRTRIVEPAYTQEAHKVTEDGTYRKNRSGTTLCSDYQEGNCVDRPGRCPKNSERAHQWPSAYREPPSEVMQREVNFVERRGLQGGWQGPEEELRP
eukprot:5000773-Amphidinium_carterae.1